MNKFSDMDNAALMDMLAKHTALYTQMLADNIKTYEFYKCRRIVEQLTAEFKLRRRTNPPGNSTIRTTVSFSAE